MGKLINFSPRLDYSNSFAERVLETFELDRIVRRNLPIHVSLDNCFPERIMHLMKDDLINEGYSLVFSENSGDIRVLRSIHSFNNYVAQYQKGEGFQTAFLTIERNIVTIRGDSLLSSTLVPLSSPEYFKYAGVLSTGRLKKDGKLIFLC